MGGGSQWTLTGQCQSNRVAVIIYLTELKKRKKLRKTYQQIAFDLIELSYRHMNNFNDTIVNPIREYGRLYPPVCKDPGRFIQRQKKLRPMLETLRQNGKKLFLITNTHVEFIEMSMTQTLGPDWKNFFDLIFCDSRTPLWHKMGNSFFTVDSSSSNWRGKKLSKLSEFTDEVCKGTKIFLQGNGQLITEFFQKQQEKQNLKIVQFGDSAFSDVQAVFELDQILRNQQSKARWESIAVVEELSIYDSYFNFGIDPDLVPTVKEIWGDYFIYKKEVCGAQQLIRNHFIQFINEKCRYAIPFVKNMKLLMTPQGIERPKVAFTDPKHDQDFYLTKKEAEFRSDLISDVSYSVTVALSKGETFLGAVKIEFNLKSICNYDKNLFVDFKGRCVKLYKINGVVIQDPCVFEAHRLIIPTEFTIKGENIIEVIYEGEYTEKDEGLYYYEDSNDGEDYVYTDCAPAYCHFWFPCFDQPDLKAPYRLLCFVPSKWKVISTCKQTRSKSQLNKGMANRFSLDDETIEEMTYSFNGDPCYVVEFEQSKKISTYVYCLAAGPFAEIKPKSVDFKSLEIPVRLFCRKSLEQYVDGIACDWFQITWCGIEYYEKLFDHKYPFDKLDQVFVPDYSWAATENVGCILYRDELIPQNKWYTRYNQEKIANTILHELSHMWFGNLVTMSWWTDLWLNESFANLISFMAMNESNRLQEMHLTWSIFLDEACFNGLQQDQKFNTHPIIQEFKSTADVKGLYDALSYGKGASFLRQLSFFFGQDVLVRGVRAYMKKFAFGVATLEDFLDNISNAAIQLGRTDDDVKKWSKQWLYSSGCSEIAPECVIAIRVDPEDEEKTMKIVNTNDVKTINQISSCRIKSFGLLQKLYSKNDGARLLSQKFKIALFNQDLKIERVVVGKTSAVTERTEIPELIGAPIPAAILLNYEVFGYAKFIVDDVSLKTFKQSMNNIESESLRKQIYLTLFDMVKSNRLAGSHLLDIICTHIPYDSSEDVVRTCIQSVVPYCISKCLHKEFIQVESANMFEVVWAILRNKTFEDSPSTQKLLLNKLIFFAMAETHLMYLYAWYEQKKIEGVLVSLGNKHHMCKKIYSSRIISQLQKERVLKILAENEVNIDDYKLTENFCRAAIPTFKAKNITWQKIWDVDSKSLSIYTLREMCTGFQQTPHRDILIQFVPAFFNNIQVIVQERNYQYAQQYFFGLRPILDDSVKEVMIYDHFLKEIQKKTNIAQPGAGWLKKWVVNTLVEVKKRKEQKDKSLLWTLENEQNTQEEQREPQSKGNSEKFKEQFQSLETLLYPGGQVPKPVLNTKYIRLYEHNLCPFCARVRYTLATQKIKFQRVQMDMSNPAQWHIDFNDGKLPVLELPSGRKMQGSAQLMQYANSLNRGGGYDMEPTEYKTYGMMMDEVDEFNELAVPLLHVMKSVGQDEKAIQQLTDKLEKHNDLICHQIKRNEWIFCSKEPTLLDMHVIPFWEILCSWVEGPMKHVIDKTNFQAVCPSIKEYIKRFKTDSRFKDICMNDKASQEYWRKSYEQGSEIEKNLEILAGNIQGTLLD